MGLFDRFRRTQSLPPPSSEQKQVNGAAAVVIDQPQNYVSVFNNKNITAQGCVTGYDYDKLLRNKQVNIQRFFELADYYIDADEIYRGIIHHVYVPYACSSRWILNNASQKTCKLYQRAYEQLHLNEKMQSIFTQYFKYGNVFIYYNKGNITTLPIVRCDIGSVALNGTPVVHFDCTAVYDAWRHQGYKVYDNWIQQNQLQTYFEAYPPEVREALNHGYPYAQLNPKNVFVMQGPKEDWQKWSVPFISTCLKPLARKALIQNYEQAMLNIGSRPFVHVKYGDEKEQMLPDREDLTAISIQAERAMTDFPLMVTNHLANASVVQIDMDDLYQWDVYKGVNRSILSAGGISSIMVSGDSSDGSTFASAQISQQTVAVRVQAARRAFCAVMNKINARLCKDMKLLRTNNLKEVPSFSFMPIAMQGEKALQEACYKLWQVGVVSTRTMMRTYGYSLEQERDNRKRESADGTQKLFIPRQQKASQSESSDQGGQTRGRKQLDTQSRTSDPQAALRGKMPKPSNPEGSL